MINAMIHNASVLIAFPALTTCFLVIVFICSLVNHAGQLMLRFIE